MWNHRYLSFSVWFTPLSTIPSGSIHVATNAMFHSFLWLSNIPLYIYTKSSLSIHLRWALRLHLYLGYCKECSNEHMDACLLKLVFWVSSDKYPKVELLDPSLSLDIAFVLKCTLALAGVAQLVAGSPINWKVACPIPCQSTCLGCSFGPWLGCVQEATDWYFFLTLIVSFPLPPFPSLQSIGTSSGEN